jgi:ribonuclease P protein component
MTPARHPCRAYRLTGAGAFEAVFRKGRRHDGTYVQMVVAPAAGTPGRLGFVLGARALPRAVDRNWVRRRLREAVRSVRPALLSYDVILRVKRGGTRADQAAAASEGAAMLARLAGAVDRDVTSGNTTGGTTGVITTGHR